jgi:hypothetical protein
VAQNGVGVNTLSFRTTQDNGLSFELLVDGELLGSLIESNDTAIPYWLIEDDLPCLPQNWKNRDSTKKIVTVCSCGEYGCGHTHCHVRLHADTVEFGDFNLGLSPDGAKKRFQFSRSNYQEIIAQIVKLAGEYRATINIDSP